MTAEDMEKALEISKKVEAHTIGWGDSTASLKMSIREEDADENREWEMRVRSIETKKDGNKQLYIVDSPLTRKDYKALIFWKSKGSSKYWLYNPETKRVSRGPARELSTPFLGSAYAMEDVGLFRQENFAFTFLSTGGEGDEAYYKFLAEPKYKHSSYSKQVIWLDQAEARIQRVDYYDLDEKLFKSQRYFDYKQYEDKYWRATRTVMRNYKDKLETTFRWSDIKYNQGLTEKDFKKNVLKRKL